ncbi:hypothetical protein [Polaribacter porphyrae]|uniref:Uncharacterized protein n=1 Tax=Polaribacter porphyrae TaxID=1137780 RepID=A0A2S7WR68_9FLAO|nr:hypothetical protein [Polaribacter porphyrae]PQJ79946.1 hypothetical protein BTO18_12535 [Polaribacter porphyrae]
MKPLKNFTALAVILIGIFSFSKVENKKTNTTLDLSKVNVTESLSKLQFDSRSSDYLFYVDTDIIKKIRGASTINAKVYIVEKASGKKNLLASENLQVLNYSGAVSVYEHDNIDNYKSIVLSNGDEFLKTNTKAPFSLSNLLKYESIYRSYISSTNDLLDLERSI